MSIRPRGERVSPRAAVTLIAVGSFALWASLGYAATVPRFFMDELYYMKVGVSLAQGRGLQFEGTPWGYGPVYPALLSAFVRLTRDQEGAYELAKVANSLFFGLAAVPIYLLARRTLPPWPSVAVVALSAAIPSTMYASVTMTEGLGYLLACWSIYLVSLVYERPTVTRQATALAVMLVAIATRPQLIALYVAYLVGLGLLVLVSPDRRRLLATRRAAVWPTAVSVAAGLVWLAWPLFHGHGVGRSLGSYSVLAQSYNPLQVAKWFAYHAGVLTLYLGAVPVIVAPVVVARWRSRARASDHRAAALLAQFVAQNLVGIGLIAAFASTSAGLGLLYDRYLFYLVPLWLIAFVAWLHDGMPRPVKEIALGAATAILVVATLPYDVIGGRSWFRRFEAVSTGAWQKIDSVVAQLPLVSLRGAGVLFAVVAVATVMLASRRRRWIPAGVVALVLAANLSLSWRSAFVDSTTYGIGEPASRSWVDDRVGQDANVIVLIVARSCPRAAEERFAALETDFFNRSVRTAATVGVTLDVRADGVLVGPTDAALTTRYVAAPPGVRIHGRRLTTGMLPNLVLWDAGPSVRVENARSNQQLLDTPCAG